MHTTSCVSYICKRSNLLPWHWNIVCRCLWQGLTADRVQPNEPAQVAKTSASSKIDRGPMQHETVQPQSSSLLTQGLTLSDEEFMEYLPFVGWWEVDRVRSDDYSSLVALMKLSWAFSKALDYSKQIHVSLIEKQFELHETCCVTARLEFCIICTESTADEKERKKSKATFTYLHQIWMSNATTSRDFTENGAC